MKRTLPIIAGPTAVGKTEYALRAAEILDGEIISCDSMQLYKYMDIGSAKPSPDELARVRHHLVGMIDPATPFSAAMYSSLAKDAVEDVFKRGRLPIVSGGTGLYLNALIYDMDFGSAERDDSRRIELEREAAEKGSACLYEMLRALDPHAAERIHPNNVKRVIRAIESAEKGLPIGDFSKCTSKCKDYDINLIILTRNRAQLYDRINKRVDLLVEKGLFEEVRSLLDMGLTEDDISMKGIGYKEIISFFRGNIGKDDAVDLIKKNTRHFAKRQLTWFRRYDQARWLDISEYKDEDTAFEVMMQWLQRK